LSPRFLTNLFPLCPQQLWTGDATGVPCTHEGCSIFFLILLIVGMPITLTSCVVEPSKFVTTNRHVGEEYFRSPPPPTTPETGPGWNSYSKPLPNTKKKLDLILIRRMALLALNCWMYRSRRYRVYSPCAPFPLRVGYIDSRLGVRRQNTFPFVCNL